MMRPIRNAAALGVLLAPLAVAGGSYTPTYEDPGAESSPTATPPTATTRDDLLHGRVTTDDGTVFEGRLRFGGDEEALWSNYFNGFKAENPWAPLAPPDELPTERLSIGLFGLELAGWDLPVDLGRPFMARFGDIARLEARGRDLRVTLRSGTVVELDRFAADDFADGVRVWDDEGGVVDLGEWRIRSIEFHSTPTPGPAAAPLHGTVRTRQGDFTGLIQWDREACLASDELRGHAGGREHSERFGDIRSIERLPHGARVTLIDGRRLELSGTPDVGDGNRGIYVDDRRYGRVLVSWDALERADFSEGGSGPAYDDFAPGRPLAGHVLTRSGRRLSGRLVYDLDESESTETLDAPAGGVDYTIPFSLLASIVPPDVEDPRHPRATVILRDGEELRLEPGGDLGPWNAGLLVFVDGGRRPEYVPWAEVVRVDLEG